MKTARDRFLDLVAIQPSGCINWIGTTSGAMKYGKFWLDGRHHMAHRVAYHWYREEIPRGKLVCHECDNTSCVNPWHLFLGTHKENTADMFAKGRANRVKKTWSDEQICALASDSRSSRQIALSCGVHPTTIGRYRRLLTGVRK